MRHFSPRYKPWDERVCAVPDGDLFKVLRKGKASVVTEHIDRFVERGIRLKTGEVLEADIIVTATGLDLVMFGGAELAVDGKPFQVNQSMGYRGIMLRDLPNLAAVVGYTNASWTLKADLSSEYFCRLINHMDATGMRQVTARDSTGDVRARALPQPRLRLHPARRRAHAQAGRPDALEALPELRPRPGAAALRQGRGRLPGVLLAGAAAASRRRGGAGPGLNPVGVAQVFATTCP